MSETDTPNVDPLALGALSGQPTPPPTKPPAGKKTLADIAAEILNGGGE